MLNLINAKRDEIAALCRRHRVRRLDMFGSAARGDFDPQRSDVDFVVAFEPGQPGHSLSSYMGLKEGLEALLGRKVDLVEAGAVRNPYVRESIERSRVPVYGA